MPKLARSSDDHNVVTAMELLKSKQPVSEPTKQPRGKRHWSKLVPRLTSPLMMEKEAAGYLGVSRATVSDLRRSGKIEYVKVRGRVRYTQAQIESVGSSVIAGANAGAFLGPLSGPFVKNP